MIDILLINGFRCDKPTLPAGIGYLAEALEAEGFSYECCDVNLLSDEEIVEAVDYYMPKYIGLGTMTYEVNKNFELLEKIRKRHSNPTIILGGPHVIAEDSAIFSKCPAIDILVKGEGEKVLCQILRNEIPRLGIPGVSTKDGEGPPPEFGDIKSIRFPKYKKFDLSRYSSRMQLASSRGCVYQCAFCGASKFLGSRWRAFSAEQIIEEFLYWYNMCRGGGGTENFTSPIACFLSISKGLKNFAISLSPTTIQMQSFHVMVFGPTTLIPTSLIK